EAPRASCRHTAFSASNAGCRCARKNPRLTCSNRTPARRAAPSPCGRMAQGWAMALLDWIAPDHDLRLEGEGVRLRPHPPSDFAQRADLRPRSRAFLQPWEPTWPRDDLTRSAYRRRLSAYAHDLERGLAYPFLVFRAEDGALVGGITLSNVRRGVAQMG